MSEELPRRLGLFSTTLLVVGGIIGSGIFFTPSEVARALPDAAWTLGVWVLGGVVALAGALTYAEAGAMMPRAGGPYVYIREAFGPLPAFLYGWMVLLSIATGALAAVALGFARQFDGVVSLAPVGGPMAVAVAVIAAMALTNWFGIVPGAVVQNALTVVKVAALALLIVGGFALWTRLGPPPPVPDAPPPRDALAVGFGAAFAAVLFTIGGWQQMTMVAGEVREPARTIPRALGIGIAIVVACYLGVNAVYLRALGRDGLAASGAIAADTAARLVGPAGAAAIRLAVMLSILGFVNVTILANSRIVYAMARDGLFLRGAARVHPRWGSPHVAIAVMAAWAVALLFLSRGDIGRLLSGVVFADWIFFALGAASVFALRRTAPDARRPYRALGYPVVPAFFILAALVGIISAIVSAPGMSAIGAIMLVAGVVVYRWVTRGAPAVE